MAELIPDSRVRKPLAESAEEEKLLGIWRKVGNPDIQDQLLEVVELTASRLNHKGSKKARTRASR
jgi:hypothetical protein